MVRNVAVVALLEMVSIPTNIHQPRITCYHALNVVECVEYDVGYDIFALVVVVMLVLSLSKMYGKMT